MHVLTSNNIKYIRHTRCKYACLMFIILFLFCPNSKIIIVRNKVSHVYQTTHHHETNLAVKDISIQTALINLNLNSCLADTLHCNGKNIRQAAETLLLSVARAG